MLTSGCQNKSYYSLVVEMILCYTVADKSFDLYSQYDDNSHLFKRSSLY